MRTVWPLAFLAVSILFGPFLECCSSGAVAYAQSSIAMDDEIELQEQKIVVALSKRGSVNFVDVLLRDAAEELSRQFQIPIVLSPKKLEEASVSMDTPVTRQLEGLSLDSILRLILKELELEFTIRNEVLLITTPEDVESHLDVRTYPVLDLVFEGKARPIVLYHGDYDSLIELITSTLKPDSWDDVGGPGAVDSLDSAGVLVIAQTQDVHRQIERLLASLRMAKRIQGIPSLPVPKASSWRATASEKEQAVFRMPVEAKPRWQFPQVYR